MEISLVCQDAHGLQLLGWANIQSLIQFYCQSWSRCDFVPLIPVPPKPTSLASELPSLLSPQPPSQTSLQCSHSLPHCPPNVPYQSHQQDPQAHNLHASTQQHTRTQHSNSYYYDHLYYLRFRLEVGFLGIGIFEFTLLEVLWIYNLFTMGSNYSIKYTYYIHKVYKQDIGTMNPPSQPKKYKKIILTGLHIPQPPQAIPISQPKSKQKSKEEQIQKSSSSSQDQTYYQNYFESRLEIVIQALLGNEVEYEVLELRESLVGTDDEEEGKGKGDEIVDVVLKVGVDVGDLGKLNDKVGRMKKQVQRKSPPARNFTKKKPYNEIPSPKKPTKPTSSSSSQQQQQTQETSSRNLNLHQQQYQQQTMQHIKLEQNPSSIAISESDNDIIREQQSKQKKRSNFKCGIVAVCLVLFIVVSACLYLLYKNHQNTQLNPQTQAQKNPTPITPSIFANKNMPYMGQPGQSITKSPFFIPYAKQDQTNKINVYIKILPAVQTPQQSLHPRNVSYLRPVMVKVLTFQEIHSQKIEKLRKQKNVRNFTHSEKEMEDKLEALGKQGKSISDGLYTELYRNPNSTLLLDTQIHYLSKKYTLPSRQSQQKPFCIVAGGSNLFQTNQFLPFFTSLLSQNYTKYRLIYIDDASPDQYQPIKIMKYLQTHHQERLGVIGSSNFYFVRFDKKISKTMSRTSLVRELCGDGDIVIDMDAGSSFVGRQALGVISAVYDGGYNRVEVMGKSQYEMFKSRLNKGKQPPNLKRDPNVPKPITPPTSIIPLTPPQANPNTNPNPNQQPQPQPQPTGKNIPIQSPEQLQFLARPINNVWTASSNYLYEDSNYNEQDEQNQNKQENIVVVDSLEEINKMREIYRQGKDMEDVYAKYQGKISNKHLANACLKTYVQPLQQKLPFSKLSTANPSPTPQLYTYDLQLYTSLLQLSHNYAPSPSTQSHHISIPQPLCFRTQISNNEICQKWKKVYEEMVYMNRSQMEPLQDIYGDGDGKEVKNGKWSYDHFVRFMGKLRGEMDRECTSV